MRGESKGEGGCRTCSALVPRSSPTSRGIGAEGATRLGDFKHGSPRHAWRAHGPCRSARPLRESEPVRSERCEVEGGRAAGGKIGDCPAGRRSRRQPDVAVPEGEEGVGVPRRGPDHRERIRHRGSESHSLGPARDVEPGIEPLRDLHQKGVARGVGRALSPANSTVPPSRTPSSIGVTPKRWSPETTGSRGSIPGSATVTLYPDISVRPDGA